MMGLSELITGGASGKTPGSGGGTGTTAQFLRGDNTWSNALVGPITIGASAAPIGTEYVPVDPTASANFGLINLGTAGFAGGGGTNFVGSAGGTYLGINYGGATFSGNFLDLQANGVSQLLITGKGNIVWGASGAVTIQVLGTGSLKLGAAASATPQSYTITLGESARAGTDTNTGLSGGGVQAFATGLPTGNATPTSFIFQTSVAGASGTTAQTLATSLTLSQPTGASATSNFLNVTGTLPSTLSAQTIGVNVVITGAGSSNQVIAAGSFQLAGGYTGSNQTRGLFVENDSAGTGTSLNGSGANYGLYAFLNTTTTGYNIGGFITANGGAVNVGFEGYTVTAKNSATNIGVLGLALNTGSTPVQVGGYFGLQSTAPTFASAALIADNGSTASPVFLARVNGVTQFAIGSGGVLSTISGIATAGLGVAVIPGVDNRLGLTAVDGAPITIYAVPAGTGKLFRITADINGTAAIAGTWTYTITYTENAQTKTLAVTATVLNTLGTATDLIHPDASTNITAQLTSTGGATGTLSVGGVAEQLA